MADAKNATTTLKACPFCGKRVELIPIQWGFAIVCSDKNCLRMMQIHYGTCDNEDIFKAKLISDWQRRNPEVPAITAAWNCLAQFRDEIYEACTEPYDTHGSCCINVLDEALNRLLCFTSSAAVEAWERSADNG